MGMSMQVSEDHCWLNTDPEGGREGTIEVTTDSVAKRALPVDAAAWQGWLYSGGHAPVCSHKVAQPPPPPSRLPSSSPPRAKPSHPTHDFTRLPLANRDSEPYVHFFVEKVLHVDANGDKAHVANGGSSGLCFADSTLNDALACCERQHEVAVAGRK